MKWEEAPLTDLFFLKKLMMTRRYIIFKPLLIFTYYDQLINYTSAKIIMLSVTEPALLKAIAR